MKRLFTLLFCIPLFVHQGNTQTLPFVHRVEIGPLVGLKIDQERRVDFSFRFFKGVKPHPNHEFGFLVGLDSYPGFRLMPLGLQWRGIACTEKKYSPYVSIGLGYGSSMFNKKRRENQIESWYNGGKLLNMGLGVRKKAKNGSHSYTWSLGFNKQLATYYEGTKTFEFTQGTSNPSLPPGFVSLREENYILNSLFLKWGVEF